MTESYVKKKLLGLVGTDWLETRKGWLGESAGGEWESFVDVQVHGSYNAFII